MLPGLFGAMPMEGHAVFNAPASRSDRRNRARQQVAHLSRDGM